MTRIIVCFSIVLSLVASPYLVAGPIPVVWLNSPKEIPDIALDSLEGKRVSLNDYCGGVTLINFWATSCAPCLRELPEMEKLYRRFRADGLVVMAISVDRAGAQEVSSFVKKMGLTFPIFLDPKANAANQFKVSAIPTTLLVDALGRIIGVAFGPHEWAGPEGVELIKGLLKGRKPLSRGFSSYRAEQSIGANTQWTF